MDLVAFHIMRCLSLRHVTITRLSSFDRNFQLSVARKTLGRIDDRNDMSLFEQRQAFSSLRAIRAGKRVGSVRTGHRVREHHPGTIPQISGSMQNAKFNSKIQIYQVRYVIIIIIIITVRRSCTR